MSYISDREERKRFREQRRKERIPRTERRKDSENREERKGFREQRRER
jgi:hypothetical protein